MMARKRSVRSGFEQRLLASLRACGIAPGARLIVGFSGGADSLALAAGLARVSGLLDLSVQLVCVDHRLREISSDHAGKARELAVQLGIPFRVIQLEPGLPNRAAGLGIEEQARRERYLALADAARDWQTDLILLGHQANDQAETVLLHLIRGAGIDGISGMAPVDIRPIPWWTKPTSAVPQFRIVRPLLGETRTEIDRYLEAQGLAPIVDESNESLDFDRNWLRHAVLPAIEQRWPAAVETIVRSTDAIRVDADALEELATRAMSDITTSDRTFCTDTLLSRPTGVAYRVIRHWIELAGVEDVGFDVVARVYELARAGDESKAIELGSSQIAVLDGGSIRTLDALQVQTIDAMPCSFPHRDGLWEIENTDGPLHDGVVILGPADSEISIRTLRPGDRWHGTNRVVFEDLRAAGIHPLMRPHLLALAVVDGGVLLIPAIYPTIHAKCVDAGSTTVGVRWRKVQP